MKIMLARSSGFCFGVKNAVDQAIQRAHDRTDDQPVFMLGELIHNQAVLDELTALGLRTAADLDGVEAGSTVIIRAHGAAPDVMQALEAKNCRVVDCTCPYVAKIHRIVRQAWLAGKGIIIAGMHGHAEVEGINGECAGVGVILDSAFAAENSRFCAREWILVAQTTFSFAEYQKIRHILEKKIAKLQIFDTICITTEDRQKEACAIARQADLMLVIGSKSSSNTQKLLAICQGQCGWTYLIEDAGQLGSIVGERSLRNLTVGITAGASTPERIIREVIQAMTEQEVTQNKQEIQEENLQSVQEEVRETAEQTMQQETCANAEVEAEPANAEVGTDVTAQGEQADPSAQEQTAEEAASVSESAPAEEAPTEAAAKAADTDSVDEDEESMDSGDISFTDFIDNIPQLKRGITVRGTIIRYDNEHVYVDVRDKSEGRIPRHEFDGDPDFDLDEAVASHKELDVYVRNIRNSDMGKEIVLSKARVDFTKYKGLIEEAFNNKTPINVKVVNVVKDGVIASYGGVDIYVHRTQLEMGIVEDLEPYRGQTLDILVTQYDPDKKRLRVSGSRRALISLERRAKAEELWETIEVGNEYDGIVRSLTDFGAFVDIGGVDGLVHVSELSWNRIRHPSEVVNVGDEVRVRVKDFDPERKRISLGYKKAEDDPYHDVESRFPVGSIVRGTVVRMFPFGAFVEIAPGVDALCHISQIANVRLNKPNEVLSEGMEVDARVLEVSNDTRRISISIKEVEPINPPGYEDEHF